MRPGAALAGTRDIKPEIQDIPGNTGLLATLIGLWCSPVSVYKKLTFLVINVNKIPSLVSFSCYFFLIKFVV